MMTKKIIVPNHIKGLIFDIDGTVADTMPLHFLAWQKHAAKHGIDFTIEMFEQYAGIPVVPTCELLKDRFGKEFDSQKFGEEKEAEYERNMHKVRGIEPVMEIIREYWDKLPIAFGTGGERHIAEASLKNLGFEEKIPFLVSAQDVKNHKPHPDTFLEAAKLIGVNPKDCFVFEDAERGIEAAIAAGMEWINVTEYYEPTIGRKDLWSLDDKKNRMS